MRRNWLRPKVVLCLLGALVGVGFGVFLSWSFTDGWQDWSWRSLLGTIMIVVPVVVVWGVGLIIAAIEFAKVKH